MIGDLRLDVRVRLSNLRFADLDSDRFERAPVDVSVAGTAANFARHAVRHFAAVNVLAAVGDDVFAGSIARVLQSIGATALLTTVPGADTGSVVIVRDAATSQRPRGARLLVSGDPAPSQLLSPSDVDAGRDVIAASDLLVIDGYSLLHPTSAAAVRRAVDIASGAGVLVCFDIVPHDIDRYRSYLELLPLLELADVVIVEVPTLARLIGMPSGEDADGAHAVLARASSALPRTLWLARRGADCMEIGIAYRDPDVRMEYDTGYTASADPTAYGDRVAAAELRWWLDLERTTT